MNKTPCNTLLAGPSGLEIAQKRALAEAEAKKNQTEVEKPQVQANFEVEKPQVQA